MHNEHLVYLPFPSEGNYQNLDGQSGEGLKRIFVASGARSAERVLLWFKGEISDARPDSTRPNATRPNGHHPFEKLISLERVDRFTSGLLCSMSPFNKFRIWPVPIPTGACHGTWHVPGRGCQLHNGWPDCVQIWCVTRDPLDKCFTHVWGGVHLHVRTCTPVFQVPQTAGRIAFKFCVWLGAH